MKTIPLNSIILDIDLDGTSKIGRNFKDDEFVDFKKIQGILFGSNYKTNFESIVIDTLVEIVRNRTKNGERTVISGLNFANYYYRNLFLDVAKYYNVPIFYWIHSSNTSIQNYKNIIFGDNIANVINGDNTKVSIIKRFVNYNLYVQLKQLNFSGVTVIGDVHGQLESLKNAINWAMRKNNFIVFLGDIVDYGTKSLECLELVYDLVTRGNAINIIGNHENKLFRFLNGIRSNKISLSDANKVTVDAFRRLSKVHQQQTLVRLNTLVNCGFNFVRLQNICMAHAAISENMWHDIDLKELSDIKFAMYGQLNPVEPFDSTLKRPNRILDWCDQIPIGNIAIVGHDIRSIEQPFVVENKIGGTSIFLDTGSGKGGYLSSADIALDDEHLRVTFYMRH